MAKQGDQRRRLLMAARILWEETDQAHPIGMPALLARFHEADIPAERKGLYADFAALREVGLDVRHRGGVEGGWYLAKRTFQPAEVKLLIDVVQSARFITKRKSKLLIEKLGTLASAPAAEVLRRHIYVEGRAKAANESVYLHIDRLHEAILTSHAVHFYYFKYNREKKKIPGRGGDAYLVTPRALLWDHERYYLAGYDHLNNELRHYRVDRMENITDAGIGWQFDEGESLPDTAAYSRKLFGMFRGKETKIRLRCAGDTASIILDQFGLDSVLTPEVDGSFITSPRVALSPPFWGWLFTMEDRVELLSPAWAVEEYRKRLRAIARMYGE